MEISSAVERMILCGGSKLGKNETYDADTLIIHDTVCPYIFISTAFYRAFSLTWPASMLIYWNKRKFLHKKRIQPPQGCRGTPT